MNITEMMYRNYYVLECPECKQKQYIAQSLPTMTTCSCGRSNLDILPVEKWDCNDYSRTCHDEMEKCGVEEVVGMSDAMLEQLKEIVADKDELTRIMRVISDTVCGFLGK